MSNDAMMIAIDRNRVTWTRSKKMRVLPSELPRATSERRLRPRSGNAGKRLVKTPKTHIRLTHALLELETWDQVLGHPVAGASCEGVVNSIAAAGERRTPYYYRWNGWRHRAAPQPEHRR